MIDRQNDAETEQAVSEEETFVAGDDEQSPSSSDPSGAEAEGWQDDLPPEDDFHDAEALAEDGMEETLEEGGEEETVADGQSDKRKGKLILFSMLGIGVLFVGGLLYLQFGGESGPSAALPIGSVIDVEAVAKDKTKKAEPELYVTPTTGETDISSLYKTSQQQAGAGGTALPSAVDSLTGGGADKAALGESTEIITDNPSPPAPTIAKIENIPVPPLSAQKEQVAPPPSAEASLTPEPAPSASLAPIPASLGGGEPQKQNPSLAEAEVRLGKMEEQLGALKKELDEALQKNIELVKQLEVTQNAKAASETQGLEEKVRQLEQQLAVAQESKGKKAEPAAQASSGLFVEEMSGSAAEPRSVAKKKTTKPKTVAKKKKATTPKKKTASSSSSGWVLRAATPDAAWVSTSSHSAELRRVGVGESLPGIGRVVEIRQNGDVWEVVGSSGTLR